MSTYRYINNTDTPVVVGAHTIGAQDFVDYNYRVTDLEYKLANPLELLINGVQQSFDAKLVKDATGAVVGLVGQDAAFTPQVSLDSSKELTGAFPGTIAAQVGVARWYPPQAATLNSIALFCGTSPTINIVVDIKKNGVSMFPGAKPTIVAGQNTSTPITLTTTLLPTDYLTTDIVSGNGKDLVVRLAYKV